MHWLAPPIPILRITEILKVTFAIYNHKETGAECAGIKKPEIHLTARLCLRTWR